MPQTAAYLERYAQVISAPVHAHTTVTSVRAAAEGYSVSTSSGEWKCRAVVIATGACNIPSVPRVADELPSGVASLTPMQYRNPAQLDPGGVLVVGASASGVQIADELQRSGRAVTLAVGEHIRMPRTYRGRDIQWWMDAAGVLDQRYDEIEDIHRARYEPSLQLAGYPDRRTLDLNSLTALGVKLVGRVAAIRDGKALFSGGLANQAALSDLKMNRLLDTLDAWAAQSGERYEPTRIEPSPPLSLDLRGGAIRTVLWATGYRADYSWLHVPVLDRKGRIRHDGGVVESPGLYLMGAQFLRRRKSALIDGAGDDARELSGHLATFLDRQTAFRSTAPALT
jgi:putative flavoprotein involved in K+ transport